MHPDIHLTLHHTRAAELRDQASTPLTRAPKDTLRIRLGWTLVELGLRLATRPGTAAPAH
ncbi:hypothetical protein SUDANB51_03143 [Streptomyces sp. enrichment culture]